MTDAPEQPNNAAANAGPKKRSRWWTVLLVVSLALNLLVIGAIGSKVVKGNWGHRHWGSQASVLHDSRKFIRSLPWQRRREIRKIWRQSRKSVTVSAAADKAARLALIAALESPALDQAVLDKAADRIQPLLGTRLQARRAALFDILKALTAEERKAFAAWLKQDGKTD